MFELDPVCNRRNIFSRFEMSLSPAWMGNTRRVKLPLPPLRWNSSPCYQHLITLLWLFRTWAFRENDESGQLVLAITLPNANESWRSGKTKETLAESSLPILQRIQPGTIQIILVIQIHSIYFSWCEKPRIGEKSYTWLSSALLPH